MAVPQKEPSDRPPIINIKYILTHLGVLIALLIVSMIAFFGKHTAWALYDFLFQYLKFSIIVLGLGAISGPAGQAIPAERFHYDKKPFTPYVWEDNGAFYQKKIRISRWKDLSFSLSDAFPRMMQKHVGEDMTEEHLERFVRETCRAEVVHCCLLVVGNLLMILWLSSWYKMGGCVLYSISNLASVLIQRYNRPRLVKLLARVRRRSAAARERGGI